MQLKTTAGQAVDIPLDEITKAASALGWTNKSSTAHTDTKDAHLSYLEHSERYMNKALDCIEHMTGKRPSSEQQMKEFMYNHLHIGTEKETNLFYECIEAIIGWYAYSMFSAHSA